jgi:TonB family protein
VEKSSGHSYLDRSAVRQIMENFRFRPAMDDGKLVSRWVEQSISFSLVDTSVSVE